MYHEIFMETGVLENENSVPEELESAAILYKAFSLAAQHHLRVVQYSIIFGVLTLALTFIPLAVYNAGMTDFSDTCISIGIMVFLGIGVMIYGIEIHKPDKIAMVSKVYPISYLIPHRPALFFDGSDIVPDQVISYQEVSIDELFKVSNSMRESSVTYHDEMIFINALRRKLEIAGIKIDYYLKTPTLLNNDAFTSALIQSIPFCIHGKPKRNILQPVLDINEAIQHRNEIDRLESAETIINKMNQEIHQIRNRSNQFIHNFNFCIQNVNDIFNASIDELKYRYFNDFDIHTSPEIDRDYGYDVYKSDYHIKVDSSNVSLNPINIFQKVIDRLDNNIRRDIEHGTQQS